MAQNGRLPASTLAPIPGGRLRADAAAAWNAMCAQARRRGMAVPMPAGPISSYRAIDAQRRVWVVYQHGGNPAARPGTSNHGWGVAVDVTTPGWHTVTVLGPRHGFDHVEGARVGEGWHFSNPAGPASRFPAFPAPLPTIRRGSRPSRDIKHLQVLLRDGIPGRYLPRGYRSSTHYYLRVRRAVRKFQREHGLNADGIVGPTTWRVLRRSYDLNHRKAK